MLTFDMLRQLAPSPIGRIRNQFRFAERAHLPTRLTFLIQYEVPVETVEALRRNAANPEDERILVAYVLMSLLEEDYFHARGALVCWLRRKGPVRYDLKEAAEAFAVEFKRQDASQRPMLQSHNANAGPIGCCA